MKRKRTILAIALGMAALLLTVVLVSGRLFTEKRMKTAQTVAGMALQPIRTAEEEQALDVPADSAEEQKTVLRGPEIYAVFGVDTEEGDAGRSDCILLMSLDGNNLRMCSLARDTLVTLGGQEDKLCHAYAYGGPQEALDTINRCYGLQVDKYVTVNFSQLAALVELLGGAEVDLTRQEWECLGLGEPYLGRKRLTGSEALAYCRIRSIDSDDMRTARQRTLVAALLSELQGVSRWKLPEICGAALRTCRTNVSLGELVQTGKTLLGQRVEVESLSIPGDSVTAWGGLREDGVWYYVYDLGRAAEAVRAFFYPEQA